MRKHITKHEQLQAAIQYSLSESNHFREPLLLKRKRELRTKETIERNFKNDYNGFCNSQRMQALNKAFDSGLTTGISGILTGGALMTGYTCDFNSSMIIFLGCLGALLTATTGVRVIKNINYAHKMKPIPTYVRERM